MTSEAGLTLTASTDKTNLDLLTKVKNMTMKKILMVAAFFAAAIFTSYATDYFVSPAGNDSNSGLKEDKPFATLGKVMPLLKTAKKMGE